MPRPIGPQPAITTMSSKVIPARSTAWSAQDERLDERGVGGRQVLADLVHARLGGNTMYAAIAPGLLRLKP